MRIRPTAPRTLGLWFQKTGALCATCTQEQGKVTVSSIFSIQTDESSVKPLDTGIREHVPNADDVLVCAGLSARDVLFRPLDVPLTKTSDIDEVFEFQAEPILPFSLEEACLDWQLLRKEEELSHLSLVCTQKSQVQELIHKSTEMGWDPEAVSAAPLAIAQFTQHFFSHTAPVAVIYADAEESFVAVVSGQNVLACHPIAANLLVDAANTETLSKSLQQALLSFSKYAEDGKFREALFLGSHAHALAEPLGISPVTLSLEEESSFTEEELRSAALPIGLALASQERVARPINLRYGEEAYPKPWKRYQKAMATFLALSLLIAFLIHSIGGMRLAHREVALRQQYLALLETVGVPPEELEEQHTKDKLSHEEALQRLTRLSPTEVMSRVSGFEAKLNASPPLYPLLPRVPFVSDLLAWLNTHPNIVKEDPETGERTALIHLEAISYTMLKRPEPKKIRDRYQIRVELEFSTETPRLAREFHDALVAGDPFVDPKGEIKWGSNKGRYKTSFYLRDRTTYSVTTGGS